MASIGLRYPVYAPLTEVDATGTYSYGPGKVAGKAITVNMTLNISDVPLYGNDEIAERAREFIDGTITFTPDDLSTAIRKDWLGNTITEETVGTGESAVEVEVLSSSGEDTPGYFGFGFLVSKIKNGQRMYRAILYAKVQFGEPGETAETKGQNIAWQTPAIEGKLSKRIDGKWKEEITVDNLAIARAWLNGKLNITT